MDNTKTTSYMIILGILIVGVFTYTIVLNIYTDKTSSNLFFSKTEQEANATIESIKTINDKIIINTAGDAKEICIKTTKTNPKLNSICWTKVENNTLETTVYSYKTYYIWIKDSSNHISDVTEYNS